MSTTQNLKMGLAAFTASLLLLSLNAVAAPIPRDPNMEASAGCKECFKPSLDMGLDGVESQAKLFKANAYGKDYLRKATPAENSELAMIGRISTDAKVPFRKNGKMVQMRVGGTATMISPCLGVTNYHTFFGYSKKPTKDFVAHFSSRGESIPARAISYRKFGDTEANPDDQVLFELDPSKCTGQFGYMKPSQIRYEDIKGSLFDTGGFPARFNDPENPDQRWIHTGCRITETDPVFDRNTYLTDCTVWGGQSGGPIYYTDSATGEKRIFAMISGINKTSEKPYPSYSHDKANIVIPFSWILANDMNRDLVRADMKRFASQTKPNRSI